MENIVLSGGDVETVNKHENLVAFSKAYQFPNSLIHIELFTLSTNSFPYCYYYCLYIYYISIQYDEVML